MVETQAGVCKKLDTLSKVRTALIVAVIAYAVAIAAFAIYSAWSTSSMQQ